MISLTGTTAVVENCMTEVLQLTDTETREPKGEPRTYTGYIRDELELIDGTWKIIDGEGLRETC